MTERVLMRPDLTRISRPGVSVWSAGYADLLFTSERNGINVIQEGVINTPAGNGAYQQGYIDVWFGKNLSYPVFYLNAGFGTAEFNPIFGVNDEGNTYGVFVNATYSDHLNLLWNVAASSPAGAIRYRVLDIQI